LVVLLDVFLVGVEPYAAWAPSWMTREQGQFRSADAVADEVEMVVSTDIAAVL